MPVSHGNIYRSILNGPFIWIVDSGGNVHDAATGVQTLGAAFDAVKGKLAAMNGTIQKVLITVISTE